MSMSDPIADMLTRIRRDLPCVGSASSTRLTSSSGFPERAATRRTNSSQFIGSSPPRRIGALLALAPEPYSSLATGCC